MAIYKNRNRKKKRKATRFNKCVGKLLKDKEFRTRAETRRAFTWAAKQCRGKKGY